MKGFIHHHRLTPEQNIFNYRLSSARMVVESAFGHLKGCWRCLAKCNDVDICIMSDITAYCTMFVRYSKRTFWLSKTLMLVLTSHRSLTQRSYVHPRLGAHYRYERQWWAFFKKSVWLLNKVPQCPLSGQCPVSSACVKGAIDCSD